MSLSAASGSKSSAASILIVDDTPANIDLLRAMMQADGYQIFAATSGEQALSIAQVVKPDLILLDVMMPGIGGLATCSRLKADESTRDIPVIFVTAKTNVEDLVAGFGVGAVDYISKPVRIQELQARVRMHLQLRHCIQIQKEQTERLSSIINQMKEGLVLLDHEGNVGFSNQAYRQALGFGADEEVDQDSFDRLNRPFRDACQSLLKQEVDEGASQRHAKIASSIEIHGRDGACVTIDLTLAPVFSAPGQYVGLLREAIQDSKFIHPNQASRPA
jgi:PAS domain S-box-containing protein